MSDRTWLKNMRGESKVKSNDSNEIPDGGGGGTLDIASLPSGPEMKTV